MSFRPQQIGWILPLLLTACFFSSQKNDLAAGDTAAATHQFSDAVISYQKAMHGSDQGLALRAARKASRIALVDLKKYQTAIEMYRFIIVASDDSEERKQAEKTVAQIYFENLLSYEKAIIEYEKLLQLDFSPAEKHQFRLNVAKCHHQLGNLDQAIAEIDELSKDAGDAEKYDLLVFRSNVLISQKKQGDAAEILEGLIKKYPDRAEKESLPLTLAVCYEEVDDFKRAIDTLEAMKKGYSHPEFLEARIERLRTRMSNMPAANGFKK